MQSKVESKLKIYVHSKMFHLVEVFRISSLKEASQVTLGNYSEEAGALRGPGGDRLGAGYIEVLH